MGKKQKNGGDGSPAEMEAAGRAYGIPCQELMTMLEERDRNALIEAGGVSGLADKLHTDLSKGISSTASGEYSIDSRRKAFGPNKFKYPPPKSFFRLLAEAFKDVTVIILCFAAIVSLIIGVAFEEKREEYGYVEGIAIVLVILVVTVVQASIDFSKERKFRQLNSVKDNYDVMCIRDGENIRVPAEEIVVGDVVKITAGDKLAADGIFIEGSNLKANESAMTGEVIDISKSSEKDPFVISGTSISEGVGHILVVAVGERSQWGLILKTLIVEPEDTPLQERLDSLAMNIGKIGIVMAALTFIVSMIRWIVESARHDDWDGTEVLKFFIDAVTIVVVAIPEGLPLAITLGLAFAMRKMMQDNNLVRRLEACETMGSATQLNADKTGTLTQNRMTVVQSYLCGEDFVYSGAGDEVEKKFTVVGDAALSSDAKTIISECIAVNSQANLQKKDDGTVDHLGSKTECALLQLVESWGMNYSTIRASNKPEKIYLFNSAKKRMSTTVDLGNNMHRLHCKGAPEIVIKLCTSELMADGKTLRPIGDEDHTRVVEKVNAMASQGLRTLLLCYRDIPDASTRDWDEAPEEQMVFLGVVGIKDPIRPETRDAVLMLKKAGVIVRMVTGDNPLTAHFIAKEAGIIDGTEGPNALMEGPTFRKMSPEERAAVALDIRVLARSSPTDKLMLVREHKRLGEVVSVTGDGTNDAPALKEADVGFALGLAGTEIAKEACDIVILDDNIQSMARAVLWGRNVYQSIRKFLQFQLVVNVVAVTLNFISACAGVPLPLGAVPLLWVNMIMDSMGALALATEPPRMSLMDRKPFGRRAPLINRAMYRNIIGMSIYQLIVCLVLQFAGESIFNMSCFPASFGTNDDENCYGTTLQLNSMIFNVFVFMQVCNEINSRRIEESNVWSELHKSHLFCIIIVITIGIQALIMEVVGATQVGEKIGIVGVTGAMWGAALLLGFITFPVGYFIRLVPLEWCIGPLDEDVTQMSKFEKLIHFPQRKAPVFEDEEDESTSEEAGPVEEILKEKSAAADLGKSTESARRLIKLRVYVHAVAFVNVVQRSTTSNTKRIKDTLSENEIRAA